MNESTSASEFCCNLCLSNDRQLSYLVGGFQIVRCSHCGLIAVSNPPVSSSLSAWYDEAYYTGGNELVYQDYLGSADSRKEIFRTRLRDLRKFFVTPGKLIEIGAAYGLFLDVAREEGWKTLGVELSPVSSEYARQRLSLDVVTGDLASIHVNEPFDVAVGWDVIEHLSDPLGTLTRLNKLLRMDGLVVLSTGNAACVGVLLYGARWHMFAPPWHLYYFTPKTLRAMLEKAGMEVFLVTYRGNPLFNRPTHSMLERFRNKLFCNRWSDRFIRKIACYLGQGLVFTIYARKVRDLEDCR